MEPSMHDLLVRQVSALVSTTADAVCTKGENVPSMEAQFYEAGYALRRKAKARSSICKRGGRKS